MRVIINLIALSALLFHSMAWAKPSWSQWVSQLRQEAIDQGIRPTLFDRVFANVKPSRRVINYDRSQPEKRLTFTKYRTTRASKFRIQLGRKEYKRYSPILQRVGSEYGVDPCFVVSLWGMESSYGRFMGSFPVINSLATLAYDARRSAFFRKELLYALHIVNDGHVPISRFKGEWAGASGHPQFLPSSWRRFAVDYNGDGRKDIWTTHADVFASIANYLKGHGWKTGQPWAIKVKLPRNFNMKLEGKRIVKPVAEWNAMGVRTQSGNPLPNQNLTASVIKPYGGPVFLAFNNYKVLLRYNNSIYYAGAVGYMADSICRKKTVE